MRWQQRGGRLGVMHGDDVEERCGILLEREREGNKYYQRDIMFKKYLYLYLLGIMISLIIRMDCKKQKI